MRNEERFSDRVETYVKYRPGYPSEALDYLYGTVGMTPEATIADVGAGTGIFSALLLGRGSCVVGVEPNEAMREAAIRELGGEARYSASAGTAEATGLADGSVDFVTCAQSFHWFDRDAARAEFRRILKPGGRTALVWNTRQTTGTAFLEGYERLLHEYGTDYKAVSHRNIDGAALADFFRRGPLTEARFTNRQSFDYDGLVGRTLSSSYVPLAGHPQHEPMLAALRRLFDDNERDGRVQFDYVTEVFWGEA